MSSFFAVQHACPRPLPNLKGFLVTATNKAFSVDIRKDGIAVITIDVPNESMNVLQATFAGEANEVFEDLANNGKVKASILISGKDNSFVAGADIKMLQDTTSAGGAEALARMGQVTFDKIANSKKPVIAAIHGPGTRRRL